MDPRAPVLMRTLQPGDWVRARLADWPPYPGTPPVWATGRVETVLSFQGTPFSYAVEVLEEDDEICLVRLRPDEVRPHEPTEEELFAWTLARLS